MNSEPRDFEERYAKIIDGRRFLIFAEEQYKENSVELSGEWRAWCFFAYDREVNIYPADEVPAGVRTIESIAGAAGDSEQAARGAVEAKLLATMRSRSLEGTGFLSPVTGLVYPQVYPDKQL